MSIDINLEYLHIIYHLKNKETSLCEFTPSYRACRDIPLRDFLLVEVQVSTTVEKTVIMTNY